MTRIIVRGFAELRRLKHRSLLVRILRQLGSPLFYEELNTNGLAGLRYYFDCHGRPLKLEEGVEHPVMSRAEELMYTDLMKYWSKHDRKKFSRNVMTKLGYKDQRWEG